MNLHALVSGTFSFAAFSWEHRIRLPAHNRQNLIDIQVTCHGSPSSLGPVMGTGPRDVRLYVGETELTAAYVAAIHDALDHGDADTLQMQYADGLDSWLAMAEKMGLGFPAPINEQREKAEELKRVRPLKALIEQLGDPEAGWSGHLHLFSFLHVFVRIPPISLTDVIARHNGSGGPPISLQDFAAQTLTFSSGPCRLFDDSWDPARHWPTGSMYYALELIYHNPNDDAIAQLRLDHDALRQDHEALKESLMKSLEKIDKRLKKIRRELSPFGTIQRIQGETSGDIKALAEEVERHQNHVVNQEAELKVLTRKIEELNALIDRIA